MSAYQRKTKKQERDERGQVYSTIDHHLDKISDGGFTVTQRTPFTGGFIGTVLTPLAQAILDKAKKEKGEQR